MVKFPEAQIRKFANVFICKKCSSKVRANNMRVAQGRISCKRCSCKALRTPRKK